MLSIQTIRTYVNRKWIKLNSLNKLEQRLKSRPQMNIIELVRRTKLLFTRTRSDMLCLHNMDTATNIVSWKTDFDNNKFYIYFIWIRLPLMYLNLQENVLTFWNRKTFKRLLYCILFDITRSRKFITLLPIGSSAAVIHIFTDLNRMYCYR